MGPGLPGLLAPNSVPFVSKPGSAQCSDLCRGQARLRARWRSPRRHRRATGRRRAPPGACGPISLSRVRSLFATFSLVPRRSPKGNSSRSSVDRAGVGGHIGAHGTHDELLNSSPLYRELVEKGLPDSVFLTRKPHERKGGGL